MIKDLIFILLASLIGGLLARLVKLPNLVGYLVFGIVASFFLPILGIGGSEINSIRSIAELGIVLLLFSVGLEISVAKLFVLGWLPLYGALIQVTVCTAIFYLIISAMGATPAVSLIFALAFSFSSTAVVIKILAEKGERGTVHGNLMVGWLLIQDLIVVPVLAILPLLSAAPGSRVGVTLTTLASTAAAVFVVFVLGKRIIPMVIHKISLVNSRELLSLAAVVVAIGTAYLTSLLGVSLSLGAFLAGVVISESHENHAVFAETRPLRDLFVVLFFVSLGFLVTPGEVLGHLPLILMLTGLVLVVKTLVIFVILSLSNVRGKTSLAASLGMSQVGEFAFVIFILGQKLNLMNSETVSVGIAVVLLTIVVTPIVFGLIVPFWRFLKKATTGTFLSGLFAPGVYFANKEIEYTDHIIICGYGRVGRWVGRAFEAANIPFVVVDYNQQVAKKAMSAGVNVIYGDPAEPEVLIAAGINTAKALVLAIPDAISQHEVISYTQSVTPDLRILARADYDDDWQKLRSLKIKKIVQPEFEGAVAIIKDIFISMGKPKEEVAEKLKKLRLSHTTNL